MAPRPLGDRPLTHAERQARYRAAHAGPPPKVKVKYQERKDTRTKPLRWRDAVAELLELQAGYQEWLDGLPESLADTPTADALRTVCDLDVAALEIEPPRGFGRD